MKYSKKINEMLTLEAREIFVDANEYDDYELVGYCRIIRALCKRFKQKPKRQIKIENIQGILKTLDERKYNILVWRYWKGYTRNDIGALFDVSRERIRQIENSFLERLTPLIGTLEWKENNIPIEALGFSLRGHSALKCAGINTVEQLVKLPKKELLGIKGIGPTIQTEIKTKLENLIFQVLEKKKSAIEKLPIDVLKFSTRVNTALKRKGIFVVGQLLEASMDEIYRIRGIGNKGYNEVLDKKHSIEHFKS